MCNVLRFWWNTHPVETEPRSFSSSGLEIPGRSCSGAAVLEVKDRGWMNTLLTRLPSMVTWMHLDFIVRNAPSGVGVLEVKCKLADRTPLDEAVGYKKRQQEVEYIKKRKALLVPLSTSFSSSCSFGRAESC
jgi:hypothetical protein